MAIDLPHVGVWARLGVSSLHGIGVFAIVPIPEETNLFANDANEMVWIKASDIEALPAASEQGKLYRDFAVRRGALLGCPANFNVLSVGWYLNEPAVGAEANVRIVDDLAMVAIRDIAPGEELTITYSTFSG